MPDIIDIDIKTPFFRPNYAYVLDLMEKEEVEIILHSRDEILAWKSSANHRKKVMIAEKIGKNAWKIKLIKNKTNESTVFSQKIELLKQGEEIYAINRGQALRITQEYKKIYPHDYRKLKMECNDKENWRVWLEEKS